MSDWYWTACQDIQAIAIVPLTEISDASHVYTVIRSLRRNVVSEAAEALAGDSTEPNLPCIIFGFGHEIRDTAMSPDGDYYRIPLTIYYLFAASGDNTMDEQFWGHSRMNLVLAAIRAGSTTFQWMGGDGNVNSTSEVAFATENPTVWATELAFDEGLSVLVT